MDTSQSYCSSSSGANEGGGGRRSKETGNLSVEASEYPRAKGEDDDGEVELNLGLSLGGKFGVDKSHKGLIRSSSIAGSIPLIREDDTVASPPTVVPGLVRTSSLPLEKEEEWRKRKELQTLRRLEAKRRRSEKQRIMRDSGEERGGSGGGGVASSSLNFRGKLEEEQKCSGLANRFSSSMATPFGLPKGGLGGSDVRVKGRGVFFSLQGLLAREASQGSAETQGGSPPGASELESNPIQGASSRGRRPASTHMLQERGSQEASGSPGTKNESRCQAYGTEMHSPSKQPQIAENKKKTETGTSCDSIEDMPSVFTIGDGPNGRKVDGILYRYGRREEVQIMCICHGNFFSAADFVKHAGGLDVEHPHRHIVVNPSSSPFQ